MTTTPRTSSTQGGGRGPSAPVPRAGERKGSERPRIARRRVGRVPTRSLAVRAVLWVLALAAAIGAAVVLSGPVTLALRGAGVDVEMGAVFRRVLLVAVLGVLVVGLHPWKDRPPGTWGLHGPAARPAHAALGVGIAFVLLGTIAAGQWAAGWFSWDAAKGAQKFASRAAGLVAAAVLISVAEEVFFRGWLFARLRARLRPLAAAAATSALFALPHLFKETNAPKGLSADPAGAWATLSAWASAAVDLRVAAPKMLGMFLFGLALSAAFVRTRSLWLGIGLHGGAVFFVQALSALTERSPERNWAGSKWLYDGPPGWIAIALTAALLWPRGRRPVAGDAPAVAATAAGPAPAR
jgi:membrane protease YdiL (CAAX protease family)